MLNKAKDLGIGLAHRVVSKAAKVDPDDARERAREAMDHDPAAGAAKAAERVVERHAREDAVRGFVMGLGGGFVWATLTGLLDARSTLSSRARLTASVAYLGDEGFFERDDWYDRVIASLAGLDPTGELPSREALLARFAGRELLGRSGVKLAARSAARA